MDQQRSAEQRQLREIERRIELGYREHLESKKTDHLYFFDAGQLARIEPFLDKSVLSPEWIQFLANSKEDVERIAKEKLAKQKADLAAARQRAAKEKGLRTAAEKAQVVAEANAKRATLRTRLAAIVSVLAFLAAGVAFQQYQTLQVANTKSVELILREADRNILQLDYEGAFEKTKAAYELKANLLESKKRLQEIAFVYTVSEQWNKADSTLQVLDIFIEKEKRTGFLPKIKQINPSHFAFLEKRYYPEMVLVKGGVCELTEDFQAQLDNFYLAKTETTNWQYFLFAKAEQREMESPIWQL